MNGFVKRCKDVDGFVKLYGEVYLVSKPKNNLLKKIVVGLFVGLINGFFGGGGGMICVPTLTSILGLKEKVAHATTLLIMLPLCICSLIVYLLSGNIVFGYFWPILIGFVIGGVLGALILKKINNLVLGFVFAIIIILGGIKLII